MSNKKCVDILTPLKVKEYLYALYKLYSYIISEHQDNILTQSFKDSIEFFIKKIFMPH